MSSKNSLTHTCSPSCFIGIGGGSVTDFTGFFSSVYKRGRPVFYFPSTLLCALDASHGGKTALNVSSVKNYLGSYHFSSGVFIVKDLIKKQKQDLFSANGELVKIAFIQGGDLYQKLKKKISVSFANIWPLIPLGVQAKLDLVEKDPFEKKYRKYLNLGHSLGHCLESYYRQPHGQAVALGIAFSIQWSMKKKFLSIPKAKELMNILHHYSSLPVLPRIPEKILMKLIQEDKKIKNDQMIDFIFLKDVGRPMIRSVSIQKLAHFYLNFYKPDFFMSVKNILM